MLNELYNYAIKTRISSPPGYKAKKVKAYVVLSGQGDFLGIVSGNEEEVLLPDIGSAAQGKDVCNILVEKFGIVFCLPEQNGDVKPTTVAKHEFFRKALENGSEVEPSFAVCAKVLLDKVNRENIKEALFAKKVKANDIIGFIVDGVRLEESPCYHYWWEKFRMNYQKGGGYESRCFITGNLTTPLVTVPKVNGLKKVGGHAAGDSLVCFDKDAFCSYDFTQAQNATVSEEAMSSVNGALERLIKEAPTLAGSVFLHWYKEPIPKENDVLDFLTLGLEESFDDVEVEELDETDLAADKQVANQIINSIISGDIPQLPENLYYIMTLSGAGGRIMVRSWLQGRYEDLYKNILQWYEDLKLLNSHGKWRPKKLTQYYYRLLKPGKSSKSISERMAYELAGLDSSIMFSIISNSPLPDAIATKALHYIRSHMLSDEEEKGTSNLRIPDQVACSLLKAWLLRKNRYERDDKSLKPEVNEVYCGVAYHLGRMMAVYAKLQLESSGGVNSGVVERYYASACTKPALVMGRLAQLAGYHLSKLDDSKANYYKKLLADISCCIPPNLPTTFTLSQQAEFAIGYYQENAFLYRKKVSNKNPEDITQENYNEEEK